MDTPFRQLTESVRIANTQSKEVFKYVFEKSDNISLWIIGLSIGGVSLIANNIGDIQKAISPNFLKPILLLLAISVISGIIYRSIYLYLFVLVDQINRNLDITLSDKKMMDTESLLNGDETFQQLVDVLNSGFEEDLNYLVPVFNTIDENAKIILYQSVVERYLFRVSLAEQSTNNTLDYIAETFSQAYGMSKEKFLNKVKNYDTGKKFQSTLIFAKIFYLIYLITFTGALFTFVFAS